MTVDVRQVREQVRSAEAEQGRLREERAAVQQQLDDQLKRTQTSGPFTFDPSEARRLRTDIAGVDAFLSDIADRIAHLEQLMPDAGTVDEARRACAALQTTLAAAEQEHRRAGQTYVAAVDAAEAAARDLLACRAASRDLAIQFGGPRGSSGLDTGCGAVVVGGGARAAGAREVAGLHRCSFATRRAATRRDPQVVRELNAARAEGQAAECEARGAGRVDCSRPQGHGVIHRRG